MTPDIKSRIDALTPDAGLQHVPAKAGQAEEFHTLVRRSDMHAAIEAVLGARSTAHAGSPLGPDADWALAIKEALGGSVDAVPIVPTVEALRKLFDSVRSTAAQPLTLSHEEIDRVFNEHEEAPQISYRYWVANALLAAANEKSPTAAAQPPGWVEEAAGQIEHLDRENNRLAREAWTWSKACEAATRKLHILSTHHPRLEVRYWTGSYWEPMYGVALDRLLETLAPAPPAASGDSTPPSEPVQGDSIGAPRPEPEAAGQDLSAGTIEQVREAMRDMLNGWKYIRSTHGDLYGVGWDRAQDKVVAALALLPPPAASQQADREDE